LLTVQLKFLKGICRTILCYGMTDDLPTARTMAPTGFRVHVWCKACRHSGNADPDALIRSGKGDIPLVRLKWRWGHCRSDLADFVMTGSHYGPSRADLCKIGSTYGGLKPCRKPAGRTFASWNMIQPLMPF
jgi:hypothetical protein